MDKWNLFLSTNVLLFDAFVILIHHFVLFFSVLRQKEKLYVKRKHNIQSSCMIFFSYFMSDGHIFSEAPYISKRYHNEHKQHVICYSAIQSSNQANFFSVEKMLQKLIHLSIRHMSVRNSHFFNY